MKFVVDSNIFVSAFDPKDIFHAECHPVLKHILSHEIEVISPNLVLIETTCVLRRRSGNEQSAHRLYEDLVSIESINWLDITFDIAQQACIMGITTGLKAVDATILQVSEEFGIPLLTKDKELKEKAPKNILVFEPSELPL
jgi:predicted nucleic acid-binding protein